MTECVMFLWMVFDELAWVHRLKWEVALHLMNITPPLRMCKLAAFDPTIASLLNPVTLLEVLLAIVEEKKPHTNDSKCS